jgi:hypothetical protein
MIQMPATARKKVYTSMSPQALMGERRQPHILGKGTRVCARVIGLAWPPAGKECTRASHLGILCRRIVFGSLIALALLMVRKTESYFVLEPPSEHESEGPARWIDCDGPRPQAVKDRSSRAMEWRCEWWVVSVGEMRRRTWKSNCHGSPTPHPVGARLHGSRL